MNLRKSKKKDSLKRADLGFSQGGGGGGFSKNFRKFCRPFFLDRPIFQALPKHVLVPVLAKLSTPQSKF